MKWSPCEEYELHPVHIRHEVIVVITDVQAASRASAVSVVLKHCELGGLTDEMDRKHYLSRFPAKMVYGMAHIA